LFVVARSVAASCIYREDPPRVTTSHNQLVLSLSKHIRHGLIAKINGKRKPWTCEALDGILVDHSRARHAPVPITSPHPAWPGLTERGEVSTRVSPFLLSSTLLQVHREQPTF
jgi:hypothetical protein